MLNELLEQWFKGKSQNLDYLTRLVDKTKDLRAMQHKYNSLNVYSQLSTKYDRADVMAFIINEYEPKVHNVLYH